MTDYDEAENFVTWKALITVLVASFSGLISLGWAAWQVHAAQPHNGAIEYREFDSYAKSVDKRLERIESKIDHLTNRKP